MVFHPDWKKLVLDLTGMRNIVSEKINILRHWNCISRADDITSYFIKMSRCFHIKNFLSQPCHIWCLKGMNKWRHDRREQRWLDTVITRLMAKRLKKSPLSNLVPEKTEGRCDSSPQLRRRAASKTGRITCSIRLQGVQQKAISLNWAGWGWSGCRKKTYPVRGS